MKNKYIYRSSPESSSGSEKKFRELLKLFCLDIEAKKELKGKEAEVLVERHLFGMLKRNGKVYTQVVKSCKISDIMPIIEEKASKNSTIYRWI